MSKVEELERCYIGIATGDLAKAHFFNGSALQALCWAAVAALRVAPRFYRHLPLLAQALDVHVSRLDKATTRASWVKKSASPCFATYGGR